MNITYYISLLSLFIFGCLFFSFDLYTRKFKEFKGNRLLSESKVYLDSSIDNAGGLLESGVRKARLALLLNPQQKDAEENYLNLLFKVEPLKALALWSKSALVQGDLKEKNILFGKCLILLKEGNLTNKEMKIAASIAVELGQELEQSETWISKPTNALSLAELLAEIGYLDLAYNRVNKVLLKNPEFPEGIFLATKLIVNSNNKSLAINVSRKLASLSTRRNQIGIEAIRHMTLINLLEPLSQNALERCIELLRANSSSKPIDFLRVYALLYTKTQNSSKQNLIISQCSSMLNLDNKEELLIFSNWLGKLGAFEYLIHYLPASKAKVDEDFFKLRMSALARLGDIERISQELNDAPIIPLIWRLVVEARSLSMSNRFDQARKAIDRLLPLILEDPRKVRSICYYLESVEDIISVCHLLEKIIDIPIHQKFALDKLIEHRSASADLKELLSWLSKLKEMRKQQPELENAYLYFSLLDPDLFPSSMELTDLIEQAEEQYSLHYNSNTQITLALAHLRNQDPSNALVAIGGLKDWRKWGIERSAWALIAAKIYYLNHDTEKGDILLNGVDFEKMDKAEKESLLKLFPKVALSAKD